MDNTRYIEARTEGADSSCYRFEKIEFINGLLDIDATYIIHLENNGRLDSVKSQLNEFHPTKLVYILYNKGYKKCNKYAYIDKPPLDLIDANLYIFKDAYNKNYKNILILEDDFIFNEKIKDKSVQKNVMKFINKNNYDIYLLGSLPFLQKVYDNNTNICLIGIGMHASIFSRKCINKILQVDKTKIKDWDYFTGTTFTRYMYNELLCYQLFSQTENQNEWVNMEKVKHLIKKLKLDVQVEPGYSIMYFASKVLYGMCIILLVWLVITVFNITI
jgi:hypothetical protein